MRFIARWIPLSALLLTPALAPARSPQDAEQAAPQEQEPLLRRPARPTSVGALLRARIREVSFDQVPFEQAVEWLGERLQANLVVRWGALEEAGIQRDEPVSIRARNLTVAQLLWMLMNEVGGETKLAYRAGGDMIVLSTFEDVGADMMVKVYDVRDLLVTVPYYANLEVGREREYVASLQPAVAQGAVGFQPVIGEVFSGVRMWTDDDEGERWDRAMDEDGPDQRMAELIDAITSTIAPESWSVNGGPGSIRGFRGYLIVRNSPLVHQKLAGPMDERDAP